MFCCFLVFFFLDGEDAFEEEAPEFFSLEPTTSLVPLSWILLVPFLPPFFRPPALDDIISAVSSDANRRWWSRGPGLPASLAPLACHSSNESWMAAARRALTMFPC